MDVEDAATGQRLAPVRQQGFREGPAGGKQVLGSYSLGEMTIPVAVSTDLRKDAEGKTLELWRVGSGIGWTLVVTSGEQLDYKPGGTRGFTSIVIINYLRKLAWSC